MITHERDAIHFSSACDSIIRVHDCQHVLERWNGRTGYPTLLAGRTGSGSLLWRLVSDISLSKAGKKIGVSVTPLEIERRILKRTIKDTLFH